MDVKATLYVYPGINGLPSIDPSSCQLMLLVNYYDLKNVRVKHYKYFPSLKVPCLECDGKFYYEVSYIAKKLKLLSNNGAESPQNEEDDQELKKIEVYKYYINDCFRLPVYLHLYEDKINRQHSLSILRRSYIFPMNMVFSKKMNEEVDSTIFFYLKSQDMKVNVNWETVSEGLTNFSNLLNDKPFLLGNKRTELDSFFVGSLAPIVLGKYPAGELTQQLSRRRYLTDYITKYIETHLKHPNPDFQLETQKVTEEVKEEDAAPPSTIVLAALFAGTAMIVFGMVNGIIRLP